MKVDFNNLRRNLAESYNELVKDFRNPNRSKDDLAEGIDDLRRFIVGIVCCYEEGNPDCAVVEVDLLSVYPGDEDEEEET